MKCPWCNAELKEGAVYCDVCGEEIYIVPDFDPEIEDTCRETIESMTKGYFSGKNTSADKTKMKPDVKKADSTVKKTDSDKSEKKKNNDNSVFHVLRFSLFAFLIAIVIVAAVCIYFTVTSENYKISRAEKAYSKGNYEKAEELYSGLLDNDKYNSDLMVSLADTLIAEGKTEEYIDILLKLSDSSFASGEQRTDAVKKLIGIYDEAGDYDKVVELIDSCGIESIKQEFSYYFTDEPVFELLPGTYDTTMTLELSGNDDIYVTVVSTVDGGETEEKSNELYTDSIELLRGNYKISAYCMNKYGIKSATVSEEYSIELNPPDDPVVLLPEGVYVSPQLLEVAYDEESCTLYYALGGEVPDISSQIYTGPIMLSPGVSEYSFMCVDENGLCSGVVNATFDLQYEYEIAPAVALDILTEYLMDKGTIISYDGTMQDGGRMGLKLRYFDLLNDSYCYVFEEVLLSDDSSDDTDESTNMDVFYSVDMINGEISRIE